MPTTPTPVPELTPESDARRVPLAYSTRPADIAHVPVVLLPAGRIDGLPIGLQLCGHRDEDASLLGLARAVEDDGLRRYSIRCAGSRPSMIAARSSATM